MKTNTLLKYDPFQAVLGAEDSSASTASCSVPSTSHQYEEPYWYPKTPSDTQLFGTLSKIGQVQTAIGEDFTIGGSSSTKSNLIPVKTEHPVDSNVYFRKSIYSKSDSRFEVLQKWEGTVIEVLPDSLTARLTDLTQNGPEEEAEFSLDEIDESDMDLLKPGAVFYWNIGYADSPSGRARVSIIRFRRLPIWRAEDLERARQDAERLSEILEWK